MGSQAAENDLIEFCQSRSEYEGCIPFFQENNYNSIDFFLKNAKDVIFDLCMKFPHLTVGTFIEDAKQFQYQKMLESQSFIMLSEAGECTHHCCLEAKRKLAYLEAEVKELRQYMNHELKKFGSGGNKEYILENGDFVLEEQWRVKSSWIKDAANYDETSKGLKNLCDQVFGKQLLKQYDSYNTFPDTLKRATDQLIENFVEARVEAKGGAYKEVHQNARHYFTKRIRNFRDYEKNKKRKLEESNKLKEEITFG